MTSERGEWIRRAAAILFGQFQPPAAGTCESFARASGQYFQKSRRGDCFGRSPAIAPQKNRLLDDAA